MSESDPIRPAVDGEAMRRAGVPASGMTAGRADTFAPGMTDAAVSARRGLEAREGDMRVADDLTTVSTMFPSLAGLAALESFLPAALEGVSSSRAGSYAGQASGSFYRGSWQPIFAPSGSTPRSLTPSVAAAGDAATGLATGAVAPGSAREHASASATTPGGLGTTTPELLAGPAMPLPGMGTAEVSGQTSRHPLQQTATFRRGVDLSRSMSASAGPFAESLELEDQAARAESAVLRLFSSTPMARPAVSMATLSPATMGSRMAALSGLSNGGSAVARRSDGAFVSSMPALSLSYAARTSAGPSLTAGASPAEPMTSMAPVETIRRAAGEGAAAPADGSSDTVSRMIETTPNDMRVRESSAWERGRLARPGFDAGTGEQRSERHALPETPLPSPQRQLFTGPADDVAVSSDPFGLAALDLGARAQTAWLGAMGIRGPVRASADLFRLGEPSTTTGAATLSAGGQGQGRFGGEQARLSGAMSASVAGALAGSTILPGMVSLAAGVQRQAHVGASTPALQRRLEALEQASSGMSAERLPAPVVRRGVETVLGGDLSAVRVYADMAARTISPSGAGVVNVSNAASFSSPASAPGILTGGVLPAHRLIDTWQRTAGPTDVSWRNAPPRHEGEGGEYEAPVSGALARSAPRLFSGAASGQHGSSVEAASMLTLTAAPLIGPALSGGDTMADIVVRSPWDAPAAAVGPRAVGGQSVQRGQTGETGAGGGGTSGGWWTGSAAPLLARVAQVQSRTRTLDRAYLASAVARLLDDTGATVTVGETGPGGRPTSSERGGGLSSDTVGRVHHALVDRGDSTAHWSVPPDPAALLMARAQDQSFPMRAADGAEGGAANLSRRSGSAGSDSGMSVPAALSGAMATSTMLPGMLSLAASVQRKAEAGAGTPGLQRRLQALEHVTGSTGRPLEATVRRGMETVLGGDLSGVRVHADTAAASAASMLGARAFALGNAVYFSQGAFAPGTAAGAALLAHELVHTRQQAAGALDAPQRSALPGHDAGEGEPPELEAHAQRTEASVLRLFSDAPLARQADATGGMGGLADILSRRAEGGAQEANRAFSAAGPGAMLRRTGIATPSAGAVARTAAGAEAGGSTSSGGTLAGGMTVVGFPGVAGGPVQRTARMDPAGGSAAVSRQSGDGAAGALPQAGNVAGHGLPSVDELVGQVIDRVKRQIALDHERSGGFLSDLMR